ncbi:MAG: hypothetical protein LQ345_007220, partial [Seirophora villosa]
MRATALFLSLAALILRVAAYEDNCKGSLIYPHIRSCYHGMLMMHAETTYTNLDEFSVGNCIFQYRTDGEGEQTIGGQALIDTTKRILTTCPWYHGSYGTGYCDGCHITDLSKEEVDLYKAASPESIFYDASAAEKIHTSSSRGVKIADKLRPLIAAIEQYGKALDIYANAYPLVLSPLWGSIRIVLHLAHEFGKYFERIADMFARIGDLLPRFRVYENLFPSHERLVQALSITYVDILAFCTEAKAVFRRERRTSLTILFKSTWKPFEQQFGQRIDDFRAHVMNVEKEAGLSHMIEASDSRAVVLANQRQLEKAKKEEAHRRIIAAIPSVDHIAKYRKLQSLRQDGTGTWILRHQIYQDCIVYYYCDYADQRTLQAETILGTLLKQFFVNSRIPEAVALRFPPGYGDYAHTLDVNDLIDL